MNTNEHKSETVAAVGETISNQLVFTSDTNTNEHKSYSLNLDRIDSVVVDDILAGYRKKLATDPSALDAKLPRMSPVTLEILSQRGGLMKQLADREFQRRADSFTSAS